MTNLISKPVYGVIDLGIFSKRIISGIVTGVNYTEEKPIYTISFGKNTYKTSLVYETKYNLINSLDIPELDRVKNTHGLKIKYDINK